MFTLKIGEYITMKTKIVCTAIATFMAFGATAARKTASAGNPLLAPWTGPYGGVPSFDKVNLKDFKPALEDAMNEQRKEVEAIVNNPKPANFDNTIVAIERSGKTLSRVFAYYGVWSGGLKDAEFQAIEQEMAPKLAAFEDEFYQNAKLFNRIEAVEKSAEKAKLSAEAQRLVWYWHTRFVLQGARLNETQKARVAQINQRLATLGTQFSQNILAEEEKDALIIDRAEDLAGLPQSLIDGAAAEAARRNMSGKWVIANTRSSMEPFLTSAHNRALREKAFRIWTARGDQNNAYNTNKIITETLKLRAERAKLLGYPTYAHWRLADSMAKEPQAAMDLMMKVWQPAVAAVKKDVAEMQAIVDAEKGGFKIQPWDYRYYAEKVRLAKYDLDFNEVKPYVQLEHVQKAMFWMAKALYGFHFVQVKNVPVFHKDVTVYKVIGRNGRFVGLWYFDPYARPGKNSGAWMSAYREQYRLDGKNTTTIVSNNSNFIKGKPGEPILVEWDDANTMFHEFGHALHGLSSNVNYPTLSGTNTARDFVEFPSQVHENFMTTPQVLKFFKNKEGKVLPQELVDKILRAKTFNSGFAVVELLASAIVDMKLHLAGDVDIDPREFEKKTLRDLGMPSEIVMRHRTPQFQHVFSGEGYASGYYSYLWSQVLDQDAFEAFTEAGNPFDKNVAKKMYDHIMSVGNTVDPSESYRRFRGRDPKVDALLRSRGFPVSGGK